MPSVPSPKTLEVPPGEMAAIKRLLDKFHHLLDKFHQFLDRLLGMVISYGGVDEYQGSIVL